MGFNLIDLNTKEIIKLPIAILQDNPDNPPDLSEIENQEKIHSLAISLNEEGLNNPLVVTPGENGQYIIIMGHSRKYAALENGWLDIECFVTEYESKGHAFRSLARDNLLQKDKTPEVICKYVEKFLELTYPILRELPENRGVPKKQIIAKDLGIGATSVGQYLAILAADPTIKENFYAKKINVTTAYALATAKDTKQDIKGIVTDIVTRKENGVEVTAKEVSKLLKGKDNPKIELEETTYNKDTYFEIINGAYHKISFLECINGMHVKSGVIAEGFASDMQLSIRIDYTLQTFTATCQGKMYINKMLQKVSYMQSVRVKSHRYYMISAFLDIVKYLNEMDHGNVFPGHGLNEKQWLQVRANNKFKIENLESLSALCELFENKIKELQPYDNKEK